MQNLRNCIVISNLMYFVAKVTEINLCLIGAPHLSGIISYTFQIL